MKNRQPKHTAHFPFAALFYLLLLLMLLTKSINAKTTDSYDRILLLHPFFENHHWQISSDSITFNVNSTFKTHTPTNVSVAGNDTTAWFTYSHNSKIYLFKADINYPANQFQNLSISTDEPIELTSITANKIRTLFIPNSNSASEIIYATSDSNSIELALINTSTKSVSFDTTASFGTGEKIHAIYGTDLNSSLSPIGPSLWIGGENGSLSRLVLSDLHNITTDDFSISGTETITAISQDLCGTNTGKIFRLQNSNYTEIFSLGGGIISYLNQNSGLTTNGNVLLKINNNWNSYSKSIDSLNVCKKVFRRDGSGIEILNSNWNYSILTLSDSSTQITSDNSQLNNNWNSNGNGYVDLLEKVDINFTLSDIDQNFTLPKLILNNADTLLQNESVYVSSAIPDRDYSSDTSDLANSQFSIEFLIDQIIVSITTRKRTYDPISFKNSWLVSKEVYTFSWKKYSSLSININGDFILLNNLIEESKTSSSAIYKNYRICLKDNKIILPKDLNEDLTISLYSLNGREVFKKEITPGNGNIEIPSYIGNQMLIARLFLKNGNSIQIPVIMLK